MRILIIIIAVFSFSLVCFGQNNEKKTNLGENMRLDLSKPSAFITFEKYWKRELSNKESVEEIWLRFHNNTKWKLFTKAIGEDKENGVYGVLYEVQRIRGMEGKTKDTDIPIGRRQVHIATILTIESGDSIMFSIPKDHLIEGLSILVNFSYEWEKVGTSGGSLELLHLAAFWSTDLPIKK